MKQNVKYVKNVLDKIRKETKLKREQLFYSIGILCVLVIFIQDYRSKIPDVNKVIKPVNVVKGWTFKEKFRASRDYHGPNGKFMWNGKQYHCKYVEEMNYNCIPANYECEGEQMEKYIIIILGIPIAWFIGKLIFQIGKLIKLWLSDKLLTIKELKIWD